MFDNWADTSLNLHLLKSCMGRLIIQLSSRDWCNTFIKLIRPFWAWPSASSSRSRKIVYKDLEARTPGGKIFHFVTILRACIVNNSLPIFLKIWRLGLGKPTSLHIGILGRKYFNSKFLTGILTEVMSMSGQGSLNFDSSRLKRSKSWFSSNRNKCHCCSTMKLDNE